MALKPLAPEVRACLRSSIAITSMVQCVDELVLNSLDAASTCIAVRLDLTCGRIQVVDNGIGISHQELASVAERYITCKSSTFITS